MKFFGSSLLIGIGFLIYYNTRFDLVDERILKEENTALKTEWLALNNQLNRTSTELAKIEDTDDHNFRTILEMEPLPQSMREAGTGGREKESTKISQPLISKSLALSEKISNRLMVEQQSMEELTKKLESKSKEWAARPAMQPIDNRDLTRFNPIFGLRLHPIYNDWRNHNGLDLTAPYGTPVYASADGYVTLARFGGGYGNVIFLNHGYGFETRYAHLSRYNVTVGQFIKRGELIGYVGSTGTSTNAHLHYEVLYHNQFINPISFLYRDLPQEEYNKLLKTVNPEVNPVRLNLEIK
jgi:murein DD-endopeptidase MepM/ murein hydrolase activator NlpD